MRRGALKMMATVAVAGLPVIDVETPQALVKLLRASDTRAALVLDDDGELLDQAAAHGVHYEATDAPGEYRAWLIATGRC